MPIFLAALLGGLAQGAFSIVGRVLIGLGFSYLTYSGVDAALGYVRGQILSSFGGLPGQVVSVLGAAKVGTALGIVMAAISMRLLLSGMGPGGVIKKLVLK